MDYRKRKRAKIRHKQVRRHGVDCHPLLPEVISEIDANPVSFYSIGRGLGYHNYLG